MLKEIITSTKNLFTVCTILALLLVAVNIGSAQVFEQGGSATYSVGGVTNTSTQLPTTSKKGIIRMRGTADANGEINGIGGSAATRIPGTVIWAKKGADANVTQNVQALYYSNLGVQAIGKKVFGTTGNNDAANNVEYYVSNRFLRYKDVAQADPYGQFEITTFNVATHPNIVHECNSDFFYDGPENQYILGSFEGSTAGGVDDNCYTTLTKSGTGDAVINVPVITAAWFNNNGTATSIVTSQGTGKLTLSDIIVCLNVPPSEDDSIEVVPEDPGPKDPEDTTDVPPGGSTDPCAIVLASAKVLTVNNELYFENPDVTGEIITSAALSPFCVTAGTAGSDGSNPSVPPAKVIYGDNAKSIAPARVADDGTGGNWLGYGIVEVNGTVGVGGEIVIAAPVTNALIVATDGGINTLNDLYNGTGTLPNMDDYRRVTIAHNFANILYPSTPANSDNAGCGEILGWIYRSASASGTDYNFHNKATHLTFGGVPTTYGMLMANNTLQGTPTYDNVGYGYTDNWDSKAEVPTNRTTSDYVNRIWEVDYTGTGSLSTVTLGFLPAEVPSLFGYAQNSTDWQKLIRGYEAYLTAGEETLTTLVGQDASEPSPWTYSNATNSSACEYILAQQNFPIALNGNAAPGNTSDAAWDMAVGSQFVFGNQPLEFTSVRNGRWSDPGTWDKKSTPSSQDNVNITYLIYTGYYDKSNATNGTSFLGARQWPINEYDLADVTTPAGNAYLADSVTIKPVDWQNGNGTTGQYVALIIGSEETDGNLTEGSVAAETAPGTAMDFDIPLLFGSLRNEAVSTNEVAYHNLTRAKLQTNFTNSTAGINGLWITSSAKSAIINPKNFYNYGTFVNEAILEVGHDE